MLLRIYITLFFTLFFWIFFTQYSGKLTFPQFAATIIMSIISPYVFARYIVVTIIKLTKPKE